MPLTNRLTRGSFLALLATLTYACAPATPPVDAAPSAPAQQLRQESAMSLADCGPAPETGQVLLDSQLTQRPRLIRPGRVRYPSVLRDAGISGRVRIGYVIDSLGKVSPRSLLVLDASHLGFVEAARTAIEDSRWSPGILEGRPVAVCTATTIRFSS